jgi:hypothetical protein
MKDLKTQLAILLLSTLTGAYGQLTPSADSRTNTAASTANHLEAQARILGGYGKLPLSFEANQGQADGRVKFLSRTRDYSLFLTRDEAVLALRESKPDTNKTKIGPAPNKLQSAVDAAQAGGVLRMKLRHANPAVKVTGSEELPGTSNYFIGNDPAKWRTNLPTFAKVKYEGIYSGIDLVYYGNQRQLEYDFIVAPGADPHRIAFEVRGAKRIRQDDRGNLVFKMGNAEIRWPKPVVYQEKDGARQLIAARYVVTNTNGVRFELAKYDAGKPLYIDPLIYSTYLGGSGYDATAGIAIDSAGNVYVAGVTSSTDFPLTAGAFQTTNGGGGDAFVTKINPAGSALVYSTYLGGSGEEQEAALAVDSAGNAYITGATYSNNFPTTPGALQTTCAGGSCVYPTPDGFVTKINPTGSALVYSTYLGGSWIDEGNNIAVDGAGNAYVVGATWSSDFPTTAGAFQTVCSNGIDCSDNGDAFVAKINPAGSALVYSTYLGGTGNDLGAAIAVDNSGDAFLTGDTNSTDFPTKNPLQPANGSSATNGYNSFVTEFNPTGSALVYSTYLGGSSGNDVALDIAVDSAGNAYLTGQAESTNFPTLDPWQAAYGGGRSDAFVTKINSTGSAFIYSTYLGGRGVDVAYSIAVDSAGNAYVAGSTTSHNFPTANPLQATNAGGSDAFVTKINSTGSGLVYSTYLGGSGNDSGNNIAVDGAGNVYLAGGTASTNFPTLNPLQAANGGGQGDAFVAKLDIAAATATTLSSLPNPSVYGQTVTFTAAVTSALGTPPDGESVTFMKGATVLGAGRLSAGSASLATSTLKVGTSAIKAVYSGDSNFAASTSKAVSQAVSMATTATALASSPNPSNAGEPVTFTATVTPEFSGTVTGTVTFYDGTTALKTVAVKAGAAKFTTSKLSSGAHTITATYNGSTGFDSSSGSLIQTVN